MKITDYAPRTGAIESYLLKNNLTGIEIGVDVGAHAVSMLIYCDIYKLFLCDVWDNPYCMGYCEGRLIRFKNKISIVNKKSNEAVKGFADNNFDFIYLDQEHDYVTVREDLTLWWPKLKEGGIMALRNYGQANEGLKRAADEFVNGKKYTVEIYCSEILIFK